MTPKNTPSMSVMYAFYPIIVITGFIQLLVPSTIHMIMNHFQLKAGEAGMIPLIYFTGILLSAAMITHLIKMLSVKQLMVSSALLVSTSLLISAYCQSSITFSLLYFFIGLGNGIMTILPGIYATNLYGDKNTRLQSTIFSFLAIGFVIGPVFPGLVSYLHISWRWCYAFPGLLIIPALIPTILSKHEPIDKAEKLTIRIIREVIGFDKRLFIGIVLAVTIAAGSATAFLTWLITFLENNRNTSAGTAHLVLAIMGIGSIIGRQIWAKISTKMSVYRTLLLIVPVAAVFIFAAPLPSSVILNISLFFMATIFVSGVNPLFLAAAGIYPKSHSSSVYTTLFIFMSLGGIIIPAGIGQIFQYADPQIGMSSISILFIAVVLALLFIKKEIPLSEHIHRHLMP